MVYYTKSMFGNELKELVLQKKNIVDIGLWAHSVYLDCSPKVDAELLQLMLHINTMELGEEFAISYDMLNKIADDLIAGKNVDLNAKEYRESIWGS
jgi:hypothetical protein